MSNKKIITALGATIAASLCCVTPILAVLAGSSTLASSFSWLAPYHNYLVAFTILVLLYAWYDKLKPTKELDCACDEKESFFSGKTFLAIVTLFAVVMLSFPQWGDKVFDAAPSAESCATGTCDSEVSPKKETKAKPAEGSACETEQDCDKKPFKKTENTVHTQAPTGEQAFKVFDYMNSERTNPTPYKQVACSGTGNKNLDAMMAQKRAEVEEMPPPVLLKMLDDDEDVILVDIREPKQRDGFSISAMESYSMPYGQVYFSAFKNLQARDNVIVVYGKFGMVSLFVASTLKKLGYKHVYSLKGGTDAWKIAEYPYYEKIEE